MAKHKPYRYVVYVLARALAGVSACLPRRILLAFARCLGRFSYLILWKHRQNTLTHLSLALGNQKTEKEIRKIACRVFQNMAQTAAEVIQFPKLSLSKMMEFVDVQNTYEVYQWLLKEGKGVILLTSHIGNWELVGGVILLNGLKGTAVARRLRYEPFQKWIESLRRSILLEAVYRDESPRKIFEILKRNEIIGILPDQDIDTLKGIFVDFFGRPAYTSVAPVKLALSSGAPIVTTFLIRLPHDRYQVMIGDVIRPQVKTTREAAIHEYTQKWMASCEAVIRRYPDQWGWMHNRWKTAPSKYKK